MCWNEGRLCWKIAKLFYFCHLKKLVRPETFGPYYLSVLCSIILIICDEEYNLWSFPYSSFILPPTFSMLSIIRHCILLKTPRKSITYINGWIYCRQWRPGMLWEVVRSCGQWTRCMICRWKLMQFCGVVQSVTYVVGSKSFRPDIEKPRQMENAVMDI